MPLSLVDFCNPTQLSETINLTTATSELGSLRKEWPMNLSILSLNIRSLRRNHGNLLLFLQSLNHKVSVITISETWLEEGEEHLYSIDGYTCFARSRTRHGGGLMILVDDLIDASILKTRTFTHRAFESLFVMLKLKNETFRVGVIYRPPQNPLPEFVELFEKKNHKWPTIEKFHNYWRPKF